MEIFSELGIPADFVTLGILAVTIILLIMLICTMVKLSKMKKNYELLMSGKDGKSLEDAILKKFNLVDMLDDSVKDIYSQIKGIDKNLLLTFQKMGLVKYDAFKEAGGKMSFVLVLLSKENNGILMNCMHSNVDGCYTYVKRIEHGTSKVAMSKEEEYALQQAIGGQSKDKAAEIEE